MLQRDPYYLNLSWTIYRQFFSWTRNIIVKNNFFSSRRSWKGNVHLYQGPTAGISHDNSQSNDSNAGNAGSDCSESSESSESSDNSDSSDSSDRCDQTT